MNTLDPLSEAFAEALFAEFPWMRGHSGPPEDSALAGTLWVLYSPPPAREDTAFSISTADGEITIGFSAFHTHFSWPPEGEDDALEFIRDLIAERILIEAWFKAGRWTGSGTLQPGESPNLRAMEDDHQVWVRSWSGRHDRTYRGRGGACIPVGGG